MVDPLTHRKHLRTRIGEIRHVRGGCNKKTCCAGRTARPRDLEFSAHASNLEQRKEGAHGHHGNHLLKQQLPAVGQHVGARKAAQGPSLWPWPGVVPFALPA